MKKCEIMKATKSYRYGCDACSEALCNKGGVITLACKEDAHGVLYCPHNECPYAKEIEAHSRVDYEEYDRYMRNKWRMRGIIV